MLDTLAAAIAKAMARSRWRFAGIVAGFAVLVGFLGMKSGCGSLECTQPALTIWDLQLVGGREAAVSLLRQIDAAGLRAAARECIYWDFPLIAFYLVGISSLLAYVSQPGAPGDFPRRMARSAILAAAGFDVAENICTLTLLSANASPAFPAWLGTIATVATSMALVKWSLLLFALSTLMTLVWMRLRLDPHGTPTDIGATPQIETQGDRHAT